MSKKVSKYSSLGKYTENLGTVCINTQQDVKLYVTKNEPLGKTEFKHPDPDLDENLSLVCIALSEDGKSFLRKSKAKQIDSTKLEYCKSPHVRCNGCSDTVKFLRYVDKGKNGNYRVFF